MSYGQWVNLEEFNKWADYCSNTYGLNPDSTANDNTKRNLLIEKLLATNVLASEIQKQDIKKALELFNINPPTNLKFLENKVDSINSETSKEIVQQNIKISKEIANYRDSRVNAVELLLMSSRNNDLLNPYNDYIISNVKKTLYQDKILLNYNSQIKLISLLNISKSLKDSLLLFEGLDIEVRAKLGDKSVEDKVIENFKTALHNTSPDLKDIRKWTSALFFIHSNNSLNAFCKMLNEDFDIKICSQENEYLFCDIYPVAEILLIEYQSYFNKDLVFFEEYIYKNPKLYNTDIQAGNPLNNVRSLIYYKVVSKYLTEKFNNVIEIKAKYRYKQEIENI